MSTSAPRRSAARWSPGPAGPHLVRDTKVSSPCVEPSWRRVVPCVPGYSRTASGSRIPTPVRRRMRAQSAVSFGRSACPSIQRASRRYSSTWLRRCSCPSSTRASVKAASSNRRTTTAAGTSAGFAQSWPSVETLGPAASWETRSYRARHAAGCAASSPATRSRPHRRVHGQQHRGTPHPPNAAEAASFMRRATSSRSASKRPE